MDVSLDAVEPEAETPDRKALLLMLSYVESECRRLGALDAARHAALAAHSLPGPLLAMAAPLVAGKPGKCRLH
jgi:hypothetical protein